MMKWMFLLVLLFAQSVCVAKSSVWKVSKGGQTLYLGGTVHFLSKQDYPLPEPFERAYLEADVLVLEVDMDKLQSPASQLQMLTALAYPPGQSLQDDLSEETYRRLVEYCEQRKIPLQGIQQFRPGMVTSLLTALELQIHGLAEAGVDAYFHNKAKKDGKPVMGLESVTQQIQFLVDMGSGEEDKLIRYTLEDLEKLPELMSAMVADWRSGDVSGLADVALSPYEDDFQTLFDDLLYQRNENWLPNLQQMMETPELELVLVGALHLATDRGLLARLGQLGYQVEAVH